MELSTIEPRIKIIRTASPWQAMTNVKPLAIAWISFGFVPLDIIRGQLVRASFPLMYSGYHLGSGTAFSIKQIIGIKGNYASVRMGDMDARSFYRSHIEVI